MKYGLQIQLYADNTQLCLSFKTSDETSVMSVKKNIEKYIEEIKLRMSFHFSI